MPRVSVGLPVYNGTRYLSEALDSLLAQDFTDFELIICDNGSTDGTQEICQAYARRDARIRYFENGRNLGAAANFNRVFELAVGEFFKWAAHDDVCGRAYLRRCVETFDASPPDVVLCYPKTILIDEQGQVMRPYEDRMDLRDPSPARRLQHTLRHLELCHAVMGLIRRRVMATTRLLLPFPESDTVLLAELALRGRFYEIPAPLHFRRIHPGTSLRANPTAVAVARWFDPNWRGRVAFARTRRLFEHVRAIRRAPLSWFEKLACLEILLRERVTRDRRWRWLAHEVYYGGRKQVKYRCTDLIRAVSRTRAGMGATAGAVQRARRNGRESDG